VPYDAAEEAAAQRVENELAATDAKMRAEQDAAVQQGNQSRNVTVLYNLDYLILMSIVIT
jgi:hypothetical protein